MNREDIIRMATEAWLTEYGRTLLLRGFDIEINIEELERFAAVVAAVEREACAKACKDDDSGRDGGGYYAEIILSRSNT